MQNGLYYRPPAVPGFTGLQGLSGLQLLINKSAFNVGESPTYSIIGAAANTPVKWSSTRAGQATGENMSDYGQVTGADGALTGAGSPWTDTQAGSWTKTATVGNESATVAFQVFPLNTAGQTATPTNWTAYYQQQAAQQATQSQGQTINVFGYNLPAWVVYAGGFAILWSFLKKK